VRLENKINYFISLKGFIRYLIGEIVVTVLKT